MPFIAVAPLVPGGSRPARSYHRQSEARSESRPPLMVETGRRHRQIDGVGAPYLEADLNEDGVGVVAFLALWTTPSASARARSSRVPDAVPAGWSSTVEPELTGATRQPRNRTAPKSRTSPRSNRERAPEIRSGSSSLATLCSPRGDVPEPWEAVDSGLASGASSSGSTVLTIPAGTGSGLYYLLARADADGVVQEGQEGTHQRRLRSGPLEVIVAPDSSIWRCRRPVSPSTWRRLCRPRFGLPVVNFARGATLLAQAGHGQ